MIIGGVGVGQRGYEHVYSKPLQQSGAFANFNRTDTKDDSFQMYRKLLPLFLSVM